jgi:hypothetical protein
MHCETTFTARPLAFEAIELLDKTTVQGGSSVGKADGFIPRMPDSLDSNPYWCRNGNEELERKITKQAKLGNLRNTV